MVSFRGQKKLGPRPDQSPFKFPTSISTPFISGVPPPRVPEISAIERVSGKRPAI